jgi:hypothetical protein
VLIEYFFCPAWRYGTDGIINGELVAEEQKTIPRVSAEATKCRSYQKLVSGTSEADSFMFLGRTSEEKDDQQGLTMSLHGRIALARERREYVRDAMIHAWSSYRKFAFGADELLPLSKKPSQNWGGV